MLTTGQQEWIDHLSDTKTVSIVPFDPTCEQKFLKIKKEIQSILGREQEIVHSGASSLRISGQDEIDIYVPVLPAIFDKTIIALKNLFGEPASYYTLVRSRFVTGVEGKHVDVFVINKEDFGWTGAVAFMSYLRSNPEVLERYRKLKEGLNGKTQREYYRIKTEFINEILGKTGQNLVSG